MTQKFEKDYAELLRDILDIGEVRQTRNAVTKAVFGRSLKLDLTDGTFPMIQGRRMFYKGVLGEFAAMVRKPKHIKDFEEWGCNYWKLWANDDGSINIDYGNAWFENGQWERLIDKLTNDPTDRRMIIAAWHPERLLELSLPCCHYIYQFYVSNGNQLDMIWTQRSCDMMIGIPADMILAAVWNIVLANQVGLKPGIITMNLGDCHIYKPHWEKAEEYLRRLISSEAQDLLATKYHLLIPEGEDMTFMTPSWFDFWYDHLPSINFELLA